MFLHMEMHLSYLFNNTYQVNYSEGRKCQNYPKPYFIAFSYYSHIALHVCLCISLKGLNFSSTPDLYNLNVVLDYRKRHVSCLYFQCFEQKKQTAINLSAST